VKNNTLYTKRGVENACLWSLLIQDRIKISCHREWNISLHTSESLVQVTLLCRVGYFKVMVGQDEPCSKVSFKEKQR
jgi:hypothetical protein